MILFKELRIMSTSIKLQEANSLEQDRVIQQLKQYTNARVAQGHSGGQTLTQNWLLLQQDFAQAKDAVLKRLDMESITQYILAKHKLLAVRLLSQAQDQDVFLTRPDLGRQLDYTSKKILTDLVKNNTKLSNNDIAIVISAGLSASAIQAQVTPFLDQFLPIIKSNNWSLAPLIISEYTWVAFADKVNAILGAKMLIVLIGERPGLSSHDSMGIYFTYNSRLDTSDEKRNCISNIHQHGLSHKEAAHKLAYLVQKAFTLGKTGIELKDDYTGTSNIPI